MTAVTEDTIERPVTDPIKTISAFLSPDNEDVLRCAAARALGAIGDPAASPALVDALLDEDPDVRTDAMAALARCGLPEDADAIVRSLEGDPVKEVKALAMEALVALKAKSAIPLLERLAADRADDQVNWEDDAGMWDDWLELQHVAIDALGDLGASQSIPTLLDVRLDEFGQDVDLNVFAALAKMPEGGVAKLIDLIVDNEGKVRERALKALGSARYDLLAKFATHLAEDADPSVRKIAIPLFGPASPEASKLAIEDPDRTVRIAAVKAYAPENSELTQMALRDADEWVRAAVLTVMPLPEQADDDFTANVSAWMQYGGGHLAAVCADVLPKIDRVGASDALIGVAANEERPLDARLAAIRQFSALVSDDVMDALDHLIEDTKQQVRAGALASLAEIAEKDIEGFSNEAHSLLCQAIRSATAAPEKIDPDDLGSLGQGDAARLEEEKPRLRIDSDGNVIEFDPNQSDTETEIIDDADADDDTLAFIEPEVSEQSNVVPFPTSTLGAIQATLAPTSEEEKSDQQEAIDENKPEREKLPRRKRRVAVDGPKDFRADLPITAIRMAVNCSGHDIEQAILSATAATNNDVKATALETLSMRTTKMPLSSETLEALQTFLNADEARIRYFAAKSLAYSHDVPKEEFEVLLQDQDASIRAVAVHALGPADPRAVLGHIADQATLVRRAALTEVLAQGAADPKTIMGLCFQARAVDTLRQAIDASEDIRFAAISHMAEPETPRIERLLILEAMAFKEFGIASGD